MRIRLVAVDTRGGVQPYAALALGLQAAGHDVAVAAPEDFTGWLTGLGLRAITLSGSMQEGARAAAELGGRSAVVPRALRDRVVEQTLTRSAQLLAAAQDADLLLGGIGGATLGVDVAERLGVPFVHAHLQPVGTPAAAMPGVLTPWMPAWTGAAGRRLGGLLTESALTLPFRAGSRAARTQVLGLPARRPATDARTPVLYGFSRHVVPRPAGWPATHHVTGYWFLPGDPAWHPPAALTAFLDAGEPPVCVGFGSMIGADPDATTAVVLDALARSRTRAVLLTGWGGLAPGPVSDDVLAVEHVPHAWLFPRVAAVVHHGGAGTTAATLRAGTPSVVVPHGVDQPYWGRRVAALGAGPPPLPRASLTAERLATAIRTAVAAPGMGAEARRLRDAIADEDGVGTAVTQLERLAVNGSF